MWKRFYIYNHEMLQTIWFNKNLCWILPPKLLLTYEKLETIVYGYMELVGNCVLCFNMLFAMFEAYVGVVKGGGVITSVR